jgi:hypothetical protein
MRYRKRRGMRVPLVCMGLVVPACGLAPADPTPPAQPTASSASVALPGPIAAGSTTLVHPDTRVIVGVDADHTAIVDRLVEVHPAQRGVPAVVHLAIENASDGPMMLGIEGAIGFLAAHSPDGSTVLDQIVELERDSVSLPGGEYVLRAYYRPCDGSCGLLDPPHEFCDIDVTLVAGGQYDLNVSFVSHDTSHCEFQPRN